MKEIIIPAAHRLKTKNHGLLIYEIPDYIQEYYWMFVKQQEKKKIDYDRLKIAKPFKARTTGEHSQNHRINGFIQQICMNTGFEFEVMKYYLKKKAIRRGYPFVTDPDGEAVPISESKIDTIEAGYLIDEIEQFAAENNIFLREE